MVLGFSVLPLLVPAFATWAGAHPHVFVEPTLTLVFDDTGLAGFRQVWVFDEMFTIMILEDHDQGHDGALGPDEVAAIRQGAFDNIRQWDYFTNVTVEGRPFAVESVTDFNARVQGGHLVYEFFVPCRVAVAGRAKVVTLAVFDPDYYVDFLPPLREEVAREGGDGFRVALDVRLDPDAVFSPWLITPTVARIEFSRP